MIEQHVIPIPHKGGDNLKIQEFGAGAAMKHSIILAKLVAGGTKGVKTLGADAGLWDVDFANMAAGFAERLDPITSPAWLKELVQTSVVEPKPTDDWFELSFGGGKMHHLLLLVAEILKLNYQSVWEVGVKKVKAVVSSGTSSVPSEME